jgi:hypothetical protein
MSGYAALTRPAYRPSGKKTSAARKTLYGAEIRHFIAEQKLPANGMKHFTDEIKHLANEIKHPAHQHKNFDARIKPLWYKHLHSGAQQNPVGRVSEA